MHLFLVHDADAAMFQDQSPCVKHQWLLAQLQSEGFDLTRTLIYRYLEAQRATLFLQYETDAEMLIPATQLQGAVAQKRRAARA